MEVFINQTREILFQLGFLPIVLVAVIIAMFVYWHESRRTGKNQNSIFDGFFFSSIIMVIWGRITYILTNPLDYEGLIWSFIPYERYPDGFFLFRLLPWRYFRIWDGEFLFTGLFIGFIIGAFIFSMIYKRWRWREMMGTIVFTAAVFLGILLSISGFLIEDSKILIQGLVSVGLPIIYFILANLLSRTLRLVNHKLWEKLNFYLTFLFSVIISFYIPSSLLASDITVWDRNNLTVFVAFSIISHIIFVVDVFRKNVKIKTEYRTRSVSISANQPVKI